MSSLKGTSHYYIVSVIYMVKEKMDKGAYMMVFGIPWWVLMLVVLIFLSGYMAFRAMRAEHILEQQFIEREGEVYINRMEDERKRRGQRRMEE
ncbi:sporulation YhaL family protein [Virgibacillus sp. W0181]